jgi:hypothetical protein
MVTGFISEEELNRNILGLVGGKYIGELRGEGFIKVSKLVWEVLNDVFL